MEFPEVWIGTILQLHLKDTSEQEDRTPSAVKTWHPLSQELCQQIHTIKQPLPSTPGHLLTQFKLSQYFQPMAAWKVTSAPTWQTRVFHQRTVRAQCRSQREVMVLQLQLGNAVWGDANRCCMPSSQGGSLHTWNLWENHSSQGGAWTMDQLHVANGEQQTGSPHLVGTQCHNGGIWESCH